MESVATRSEAPHGRNFSHYPVLQIPVSYPCVCWRNSDMLWMRQ